MRLVYSEQYDLNLLGDHVFPSKKYKWLHDRMLWTRFATRDDFVAPEPATDDDVLLVHDAAWVSKLRNGTISYQEILQLEIPYSTQMVEAFWLAAGGTTLAARHALESRIGFNLGGGFHHAFPGHGEGFCAINDVAVAIRCLQRDGAVKRAMVVDCDVHHGNGTASIFAGDATVFTLSIHQLNNYPTE
jgi:acetoin utilization deacetylase AcuC-like enzyme